MANETTIIGRVAGGHRIADLGIEVGRGERVRVDSSRASASGDLRRAERESKVRIEGRTCRTNRQRVLKASGSPSGISGQERGGFKAEETSNSSESAETEVVRHTHKLLERQNGILERIEKSLSEQRSPSVDLSSLEDLVRKLADRPIAAPVSGSTGSGRGRSTNRSVRDETPQYIPSKIKSGRVKTPKKLEAEEGENSSSAVDETAALLRAMKQQDEE